MLITLIVLSLANVKNETPQTKPANKLGCLNPVKVNPKIESNAEVGTEKCLAIPDKSSKPKGKQTWK